MRHRQVTLRASMGVIASSALALAWVNGLDQGFPYPDRGIMCSNGGLMPEDPFLRGCSSCMESIPVSASC